MPKKYIKKLSKKRSISKRQSKRNKKQNSKRKKNKQTGSGWAPWVGSYSKPNPYYSRAEAIPFISEMGDFNPYL